MTNRIQISPPNFPFAGHTTLKPSGKEDPMEFYVTDACIGWEKTEQLVCDLADLR